jgi:hypothetical protein
VITLIKRRHLGCDSFDHTVHDHQLSLAVLSSGDDRGSEIYDNKAVPPFNLTDRLSNWQYNRPIPSDPINSYLYPPSTNGRDPDRPAHHRVPKGDMVIMIESWVHHY